MNLVIRLVLFYLLIAEEYNLILGLKLDLPVEIVLREAAVEVMAVVAMVVEVVVEVDKILSIMLLRVHLYRILLV